MKKIQMAGVALAVCSGMAFADPLWTVGSRSGQVQFPWIVECTSSPNFDETADDDPCYKDYGGWWFGYLAGWEPADQVGPKVCIGEPGMPEDGGAKSKINTVKAKIGGEWVSFIGPDYTECEGPAVTDKSDGTSLMSPDGLELQLTIGDGYPGLDKENYEPSIAGVAVSLTMDPKKPQDVDKYGGFCLTYESDHQNNAGDNAGAEMQLELGWDEGIKANLVKGYDSWYARIPEASGKKTVDFTWKGTSVWNENCKASNPPPMNESGDFMQDDYTCWKNNQGKPAGAPFKIESATKELVQVKIRLKGYEAQTVNFKLIEFGWLGECGNGSSPIVAGGVRPVNTVSFNTIGKTLTMNSTVGKPLAVQVINLQGAVVKSATMSNGDKVNLQNLPTGIYMIRVPSQNYTVKHIVK